MNPRPPEPQSGALANCATPTITCSKGFEPPTHGLEGRCSIQLSYEHISQHAFGMSPGPKESVTCGDTLGHFPTCLRHVASSQGIRRLDALYSQMLSNPSYGGNRHETPYDISQHHFVMSPRHKESSRKRAPPYDIKRVMGIEPTYLAWKASVLPLNYTRIYTSG